MDNLKGRLWSKTEFQTDTKSWLSILKPCSPIDNRPPQAPPNRQPCANSILCQHPPPVKLPIYMAITSATIKSICPGLGESQSQAGFFSFLNSQFFLGFEVQAHFFLLPSKIFPTVLAQNPLRGWTSELLMI